MAVYCFGEFELNEDSRGLRLAGNEIEVQPLVFDFLALLLRHQDRALSKAELFDALWPGVTVTEASLQRAASLARGVLRQGGMEAALRNLPRFGYRLCLIHRPLRMRCRFLARKWQRPQRRTARRSRRCGRRFVSVPPLMASASPMPRSARGRRCSRRPTGSIIWNPTGRARSGVICCTRWPRSIASSATMRAATGCRTGTSMTSRSTPSCADLESVVEAAGLERFPLLGISQGCAVSVAYAVKHPERVSHLVLYGGFARGRRKRGSPAEIEQADAVLTLMRHGWGRRPGISPDLHDALPAEWHARADALVQRPAEEHGFGRERYPHQAGLREH